MNVISNSRQRYLTTVLCFVMASFIAAPLAAQEKPADALLAVEAPATAEAEAPELTEEAEKAIITACRSRASDTYRISGRPRDVQMNIFRSAFGEASD